MAKVTKLGKKSKGKSKLKKKGSVEVSLPVELSKPVDDVLGYSYLIYGEKKIGKTTMLSKAIKKGKKVMFLMFEPGGRALKLYQSPVQSWEEFKGYVKLLLKSKEFGTVVIDTADIAYDRCLRYACDKLSIEHPADEGWGKGWSAVKKEFTEEVNKLLHSGMGVFFISHAKKDEIRSRRGDSWHETGPTMSGQAKDVLEGVIDVWIHYRYNGDKRTMVVVGNEETGAGHRLEGRFLYTDGSPIKEISAGNSAQEAWDNLVKGFHNNLEKPKGGVTIKKKKSKKFKLKKKKKS